MKLLVVVALFAFVAVKISQAAPAPEEEKKEDAALVSKMAAEVTPSVTPAVAEARSMPEASPEAPAASSDTPAPAA